MNGIINKLAMSHSIVICENLQLANRRGGLADGSVGGRRRRRAREGAGIGSGAMWQRGVRIECLVRKLTHRYRCVIIGVHRYTSSRLPRGPKIQT